VKALVNDTFSVQLVVLKAIFDLLLLFGLDNLVHSLFVSTHTHTPTHTHNHSPQARAQQSKLNEEDLLDLLSSFLSVIRDELRTTAVEGFSKLFFNQTIRDPKVRYHRRGLLLLRLSSLVADARELLARLLVMIYDPSTEKQPRLRSCLANLFPALSRRSRKSQELIEQVQALLCLSISFPYRCSSST
jgi:hypothetical protein